MNILRRRRLTVLALISLGFAIMGSTVVWAAPMLWSYPDDHVLISEIHYQGSPGLGDGTEWIELYNPTNSEVFGQYIYITWQNGWMEIPTPTPLANGTPSSYPTLRSQCFLYIAYDAGAFFDEYNQCPDYADILDVARCPDTIDGYGWDRANEIDDVNETVCLYRAVDAVGWGSGGNGPSSCSPVEHPLVGGADLGETLLRGADSPEWIGPGAEGVEVAGTPQSEQLDEVWNLSGDVDVPWEGPEVGMCRRPTAVSLTQTPQATTAQSIGKLVAVVGMLGLITCIVFARRREAAKRN